MPIHNNEKAFSLPETLLTVFLLASVILYFILAFVIGKYTIQLSKERIIASNLLREDMESVLGASYTAIDGMAGSTNININDGLKNFPATRTLSVLTVDPAIYGYKKIYASIQWTGGVTKNRALSEDMVAYVTKK